MTEALGEKEREVAQLVAYIDTYFQLEWRRTYVNEKARTYGAEVFEEHTAGHLRRVAAASLVRLPGCLKAVILLTKDGLMPEAFTIVRTIVEMAITLCWVGLDEQRAQAVWNRHVADVTRGLERVRAHAPGWKVEEWEDDLLRTMQGEIRPSIRAMAEQALDTDALKGHELAKTLHDYLYDLLSAASHGDLRYAEMIAAGSAPPVSSAVRYAANASHSLLLAASAQLGFRPDFEKFFKLNSKAAPTTG
jgi:hypothetical protein